MPITLNLRTRMLTSNGRSVRIRRRCAAYLATMEQCRPGFVSARILTLLGSQGGCSYHPRTTGHGSRASTLSCLRAAFLGVGVHDPITTIEQSPPTGQHRRVAIGYRLDVPIDMIDKEAA